MAKIYYGVDRLREPDGTYINYIFYSNSPFVTTTFQSWEWNPDEIHSGLESPSYGKRAALIQGDITVPCDATHKLVLPENSHYLFYGITNESWTIDDGSGHSQSFGSFNLDYIDFTYALNTEYMFGGSSIPFFYLNQAHKFRPLSAKGMLQDCTNLEYVGIEEPDSTNNIDISYLFDGCTALKSVTFGNNFRNNLITGIEYLFYNCSSLESIDLSFPYWNSTFKSLAHVLDGCTSLTSFSSNINTRNVENFEYFFNNCKSLEEINIHNWDFYNAKDISYIFYGCDNLVTIELPPGDINDYVETVAYSFANCPKLKYIWAPKYTTWGVNITADYSEMFVNSTQLPDFDPEEVGVMSATNRKFQDIPCYFMYHTFRDSDVFIMYNNTWYKISASQKVDGVWEPVEMSYCDIEENTGV